jgi:hypothetical protein
VQRLRQQQQQQQHQRRMQQEGGSPGHPPHQPPRDSGLEQGTGLSHHVHQSPVTQQSDPALPAPSLQGGYSHTNPAQYPPPPPHPLPPYSVPPPLIPPQFLPPSQFSPQPPVWVPQQPANNIPPENGLQTQIVTTLLSLLNPSHLMQRYTASA